MKFIAAIFSVYILALTFAPCADSIMGEHEHTITHHGGETDHEGEDSHSDDCSPFCQCQCCHTNVVTSAVFVADVLELVHPSLDVRYIGLKGILKPHSIYHPPRV